RRHRGARSTPNRRPRLVICRRAHVVISHVRAGHGCSCARAWLGAVRAVRRLAATADTPIDGGSTGRGRLAFSARPAFTILVAARNAEATIGRALASIRDEACQVILIDHASSDRTIEIAREVGGSSVRVVSAAECKTLGAVRQVGLALAPTRFAAWLDADD